MKKKYTHTHTHTHTHTYIYIYTHTHTRSPQTLPSAPRGVAQSLQLRIPGLNTGVPWDMPLSPQALSIICLYLITLKGPLLTSLSLKHQNPITNSLFNNPCLLYTSDAADE